jgi:hypothetical protein
VSLKLGLRFLQASLLVPLHRFAQAGTRALPIRFEEVSRVKKPSRKAKPEDWQACRLAVKQHNLSQRFAGASSHLRQALDGAGGENKILVLAGDGSFRNRTCLRAPGDRTELLVRARKDAVLCLPAPPGSRRFYDIPLTVGGLKSIAAMRRTRLAWGKPSYGTLPPFPNNPSYR